MTRVYKRRFDHEEARRRWGAGETINALAEEYGVTYNAVWLIVHPDRYEAQKRYRAEWGRQARCPDCGAQTTRPKIGGDHRCRACATVLLATSVRDGELHCANCDEWKPDDAFPRSRRGRKLRRGRHQICRVCATVLRRDYRERHKIPCRSCGSPRLPANETGGARRGSQDTGLCFDCYQASRRAAA